MPRYRCDNYSDNDRDIDSAIDNAIDNDIQYGDNDGRGYYLQYTVGKQSTSSFVSHDSRHHLDAHASR